MRGGKLKVINPRDERAEAKDIYSMLSKYVLEGRYRWRDIAVLSRTRKRYNAFVSHVHETRTQMIKEEALQRQRALPIVPHSAFTPQRPQTSTNTNTPNPTNRITNKPSVPASRIIEDTPMLACGHVIAALPPAAQAGARRVLSTSVPAGVELRQEVVDLVDDESGVKTSGASSPALPLPPGWGLPALSVTSTSDPYTSLPCPPPHSPRSSSASASRRWTSRPCAAPRSMLRSAPLP